jgi:hypothetical protein
VRPTGRRSTPLEGFSLHADVAVRAHRRDQLERLVRYLVRPPLALERLKESLGGLLLYQFRRAWRDGSTALLLDPLELLERLAALVPAPRRPLLAYHGVLAPRARWRAAIVPTPSPAAARQAAPVSRRWPSGAADAPGVCARGPGLSALRRPAADPWGGPSPTSLAGSWWRWAWPPSRRRAVPTQT